MVTDVLLHYIGWVQLSFFFWVSLQSLDFSALSCVRLLTVFQGPELHWYFATVSQAEVRSQQRRRDCRFLFFTTHFCCHFGVSLCEYLCTRLLLQGDLDIDSDTPGTSTGHRVMKSTPMQRCRLNWDVKTLHFCFYSQQEANSKKRGVALDVKAWRGQCRELLRRMTVSPDSEPFRQPVDLFEYPVKCPLDSLINIWTLQNSCKNAWVYVSAVDIRTTGTSLTRQWTWEQCRRHCMKGIMKTQWSSPKMSVSFSATLKRTRQTRNPKYVKTCLCSCNQEESLGARPLTSCFSTRFTPWLSTCRPSSRRTSLPSSQTTSPPFKMSGGLGRGKPTGRNCTMAAALHVSARPPGTKLHFTPPSHLSRTWTEILTM